MLKSLFRKHASPPAETPQVTASAAPGARNFVEAYGHLTLHQLYADWREIDLDPDTCEWANFPPREFLEFCRSYPPTPFGDIPPSPDHLKTANYLLTQAHRLWVTSSLIHDRLKALNARKVLDVGSFPFVVPLILRDYFGFQGQITATANLPLWPEHLDFLAGKKIDVDFLELDPYVRDPDSDKVLPRHLEGKESSFDFVICSHVIEHLYHPRCMLEECRRVLRDGGEIAITTDNAMMLDTFQNYVSGYGYIFEPVQQTAAMQFSYWRGHVRFFTDKDLRTMLEQCGLTPTQTHYFHCFYDVFFPEYFKHPVPRLQEFKARMLAETPWMRNDIAVIARKAP